MFRKFNSWLNEPRPPKPTGFRDYSETGQLGSLAGKWHIRWDCENDDESRGTHYGAITGECFTLIIYAFGDLAMGVLLWLAGLVPHVLKWGTVLIVGTALAAAIALGMLAIGFGLAVDTDTGGLLDFLDKFTRGEFSDAV